MTGAGDRPGVPECDEDKIAKCKKDINNLTERLKDEGTAAAWLVLFVMALLSGVNAWYRDKNTLAGVAKLVYEDAPGLAYLVVTSGVLYVIFHRVWQLEIQSKGNDWDLTQDQSTPKNLLEMVRFLRTCYRKSLFLRLMEIESVVLGSLAIVALFVTQWPTWMFIIVVIWVLVVLSGCVAWTFSVIITYKSDVSRCTGLESNLEGAQSASQMEV